MADMMSVDAAGRALGVSRSTVWRLMRRGELPSVRRGGRRLISASAVCIRACRNQTQQIPAFTRDHPLFRLLGAGCGGGRTPGARDKHAILERHGRLLVARPAAKVPVLRATTVERTRNDLT